MQGEMERLNLEAVLEQQDGVTEQRGGCIAQMPGGETLGPDEGDGLEGITGVNDTNIPNDDAYVG